MHGIYLGDLVQIGQIHGIEYQRIFILEFQLNKLKVERFLKML